MKVTHKIRLRFALAHSKFYPFPPLPPPTNVGSLVCIMATTRFHIFLYAISARQPTLQGGGRGGDRMRLGIYQKFPLYPVKRQFPILSQNNYRLVASQLMNKQPISLCLDINECSTGGHSFCPNTRCVN